MGWQNRCEDGLLNANSMHQTICYMPQRGQENNYIDSIFINAQCWHLTTSFSSWNGFMVSNEINPFILVRNKRILSWNWNWCFYRVELMYRNFATIDTELPSKAHPYKVSIRPRPFFLLFCLKDSGPLFPLDDTPIGSPAKANQLTTRLGQWTLDLLLEGVLQIKHLCCS